MALMKLSAIAVTDLSGKSGGSVFAKNKGGAYSRNFVVPNNPKTLKQVAVRADFGASSILWRSLTQEQRDAWNAAATSFPYVNRVGDSKILSGLALYVKLNQNLKTAGQPRINWPPTPQGARVIESLTVTGTNTVAGDSFDLNVMGVAQGTSAGSDRVLVFATPVVSAGITNVNNKYRLIGFGTMAAFQTGLDMSAGYTDSFGQPAIGGKIGVRVVSINGMTGERGPDVQVNIIVETAV